MSPTNPAVYECPKTQDKLHLWLRNKETKEAFCVKCLLALTPQQADEVFDDK
jgi:Zn ribbon nucleic-acid-binding protein